MVKEVNVKELTNIFKKNISVLGEEPEFQWSRDQIKYAVDAKGEPAIKLAVGDLGVLFK